MLIEQLKSYVSKAGQNNTFAPFLRNTAKEFLQFYILNFLYSNPKYNQLIFIGGTCLRVCFDLPRLSEDLDFNSIGEIDKKELASDLAAYFKTNLLFPNIEAVIKGQYEKIYLKFDCLREAGLANGTESNKLYVKVEISPEQTGLFTKEVSFISKNNFNFLLSRYSLPDLMAGKIGAIFTRAYFKGKENEIDFKGRDFFDLIWYMNQNIQFNLGRLNKALKLSGFGKDFIDRKSVILEIGKKIESLNLQHLEIDLLPFMEDKNFLESWLKNFKDLFLNLSKKYL